MMAFLQGATAMGFAVATLFFGSFYRQTRDRFFLALALAFVLLAAERAVLGSWPGASERAELVYLLRLGAFLVLLAGIVDKNRRA